GLGALPAARRGRAARRPQPQRPEARHRGVRVRRAGHSRIRAARAPAAADVTAMLDIRQIHKTFNADTPNEVRALRGVTLSIDDGSFVVVIGTNGSGKSTLLTAVAGGFPLDAGAMILDGTDVTKWPEHRRAKMIGRVFQNPFSG